MLLALPIKLGRGVLSVFVEIADMYAFVIGFYVLWGIGHWIGAMYEWLTPHFRYYILQNDRMNGALPHIQALYSIVFPHILQWGILSSKILIVGVLWFCVLPVMVGLWINFTILIPVRVDINQTPTFYPYYTFALGFLYLKIWYRLMMLEGLNNQWNTRLNKVHQDGLRGIDIVYILRYIIIPVLNFLLLRLCVPYFLIKTVIPALDLPEMSEDYWKRYLYLNFSTLIALINSLTAVTKYLVVLHRKIRDDKYLIGEQLQNIGDTGIPTAKTDTETHLTNQEQEFAEH